MNHELYVEYRRLFNCIIVMPEPSGVLTLLSQDRKFYAIDDVPIDEINRLMRDSIESVENLLLEKYKSNEYKLPTMNPKYEY